ncbi:hypothetical protein B0O99DRAFT_54547 [Bisporella sp. PMI_857]|nr:hypothetical protein B0O99DRAFT_54547 [Bisporella sp. PMI_857]
MALRPLTIDDESPKICSPEDCSSAIPCVSPIHSKPSSPSMDAMRESLRAPFTALQDTLDRMDINDNDGVGESLSKPPPGTISETTEQFRDSPTLSISTADYAPTSSSIKIPPASPPISITQPSPIPPSQVDTPNECIATDSAPRVPLRCWITKDGKPVPAAYNEYGELVDLDSIAVKPVVAGKHASNELLRAIKREFYQQ